ncbi:MAG: hypothetical protein ACK559_04890 [bacterium]
MADPFSVASDHVVHVVVGHGVRVWCSVVAPQLVQLGGDQPLLCLDGVECRGVLSRQLPECRQLAADGHVHRLGQQCIDARVGGRCGRQERFALRQQGGGVGVGGGVFQGGP